MTGTRFPSHIDTDGCLLVMACMTKVSDYGKLEGFFGVLETNTSKYYVASLSYCVWTHETVIHTHTVRVGERGVRFVNRVLLSEDDDYAPMDTSQLASAVYAIDKYNAG